MTEHLIVRVITKMLVPFILLFGLYVQMHGDYGPGGGFQAGVIFATGFVVYAVVFGVSRAMEALPRPAVSGMVACGLVLYAGVGIATMVMGGNLLDYNVFDPAHPSHGQHIGILVIELGVGITVAGTIVAIFFTFAERWRP